MDDVPRMAESLQDLVAMARGRLASFSAEAHFILATHEAAPSRIISLEDTYDNLTRLSLQQDELFRQSLRCLEHGLYRASHVMAWAGFMDFLEEKLASDGLVKLKALRSSWKGSTIEEMREYVNEFSLIDVTQPLGLCTKNEMKALHGLLNKRNECAHPSGYAPGLNETLGYLSELLARIQKLQSKSL
jgi:hypothetical protein